MCVFGAVQTCRVSAIQGTGRRIVAVPFETNILIHTQGGIVTRAAKDKQNEWQEARIVRKNTSDNVANLAQLGLIAEHSRVAEGAASPARVQIWNEAIQRFYLEHEPSIVMYLNVCTCGLPLCECSLEEPRDASRQLLTDVGPKPILRPVDGRHRRQSESLPKTIDYGSHSQGRQHGCP